MKQEMAEKALLEKKIYVSVTFLTDLQTDFVNLNVF